MSWISPAANYSCRIAGNGFAFSPALSVIAGMSARTSPFLFVKMAGVVLSTAPGVAMKVSACLWRVMLVASGSSTGP